MCFSFCIIILSTCLGSNLAAKIIVFFWLRLLFLFQSALLFLFSISVLFALENWKKKDSFSIFNFSAYLYSLSLISANNFISWCCRVLYSNIFYLLQRKPIMLSQIISQIWLLEGSQIMCPLQQIFSHLFQRKKSRGLNHSILFLKSVVWSFPKPHRS